jgi:hypothetical protein
MGVTTKTGMRLRSMVCETEVVVVKSSVDEVDLRCGGRAMALMDEISDGDCPLAGFDAGTLVGKRYVDTADSIELLCTRAGVGSLSIGQDRLEVKAAKPLPASD